VASIYFSFQPGLPDGLFSNQKFQFGEILECLGMENVGIFYDHLEYFPSIWYNLWLFDMAGHHLVYFSQFGIFFPIWYVWTKKNLATLLSTHKQCILSHFIHNSNAMFP
jgi:hypothetical protein